jgi:hypothetical protein
MIKKISNAVSAIRSSDGRVFFTLAAVYYASVFSLTGYSPGPGLDPSFVWAANVFSEYGLEIGRDLIHVWGPWGWLFYPGAVHGHLEVFWVFTGLLYFMLLGALWHLAGRDRSYWRFGFFLLVCSYFFPGNWLETQIYTLLLILYLWDYRERRWWVLAAAAGLSAVYFYVKFNLTVSLTMLFLAHVFLSGRLRGPDRAGLAALAVFPVGLLLGGFRNFSCWESFRNWLFWSLEIAAGNSEAMSVPAARLELVLVFLALIVLGAIALVVWRGLGRGPALLWSGLTLVVFYFEFKHGLVRADRHILAFFRMVPILAASALLLGRSRGVALLTAAAVVIGLAGPMVRYEPAGVKMPLKRLVKAGQTWRHQHRVWQQKPYQKVLPEEVLTAGELDLIGDRPVEVVPFDLSQVRDRGLNWRPSPFFQYFLARTEASDRVNATHLLSPEAADYLLWTWQPFDGCHPLYVAPATHLAIMERYRLVRQNGPRLLFEKGAYRPMARRSLGRLEAGWEEPIPIPMGEGVILARIHFRYRAVGKFLKALLWVPPIHLTFSDRLAYRAIPATAGEGLVVGNFPTNVDEFTHWLNTGRPASTCHRGGYFSIGPKPWGPFFERTLTVEFEELTSVCPQMVFFPNLVVGLKK